MSQEGGEGFLPDESQNDEIGTEDIAEKWGKTCKAAMLRRES